HTAVAESLHNLGYYQYTVGAYAAADSLFREAARQRRRLLGEDDPDLLTGLGDLSVLLRRTGRYAEAEAVVREVVAILRRLPEDDVDGPSNLAAGLVNHGGILIKQERFEEAE